MTNSMIILMESIELMKRGIISGSGTKGEYTDRNGETVVIELPEQIHTFAEWKRRGYIVKRGEHAIASFVIWKYKEARRPAGGAETEAEPDADGEQAPARMFLKKSHFFKASQVEPLRARA